MLFQKDSMPNFRFDIRVMKLLLLKRQLICLGYIFIDIEML